VNTRPSIVRGLEFVTLFCVLPALLMLRIMHPPIIVFLLVLGAYCLCVLLLDRSFDRAALRRPIQTKGLWLPLIAATFALAVVVAWFFPERLFELPRRLPALWALIMVLYPLLSVVPQEIIYRVFFFHRYGPFIRDARWIAAASALVFGLHHAIFGNWIAVALTIAGGWKFAQTYAATRSLRTVWLEHALYGCAIFSVGLGRFFYSGSWHFAERLLHR
jgi:hypothetical protein